MKRFLPIFAVTVIFLILQLATLKDYGINWDAPFRMIRGQIFLDELTLRKTEFLSGLSPMLIFPGEFATRFDFLDGEESRRTERQIRVPTAGRKSFYEDGRFAKYFLSYMGGHPPLTDILAAVTNRVFYQTLSVFSDIDSYKVAYVLLAAIGVFIVGAFTYELTGSIGAGIIAGLVLGLYPLFFGDAHINMKDPAEASFFAGAIWAFWHFVKDNNYKWFIAFWVFVALAFTTKWNVLFLPAILIPWLTLTRRKLVWSKLIVFTFAGVLSVLAFFMLIWPVVWNQKLNLLIGVVQGYQSLGLRSDSLFQPFLPTVLLIFQTPEIVLILFITGVYGIFNKKFAFKFKEEWLLGLWILIPILRVSLPHFFFYLGIRQIMEVLPAMAILAGFGFWLLMRNFPKFAHPIILICLIGLIWPIWSFHPNENLYFNLFIGGFSGAKKQRLVDQKLSYGNVYKQVAEYLNLQSERNARVAFLDGPMFALSPLFLRSDIRLAPKFFSGFSQKGEYIVARSYPDLPHVFSAFYPQRFLKPIHKISLQGETLVTIYKNDPKHSLTKIETGTIEVPNFEKNSISLGKEVKIKSLIVSRAPEFCIKENSHFYDSVIRFLPSGFDFLPLERMELPQREREIFIPGESASAIEITPLNPKSCFNIGKVTRINYLK